MDRQIWESLSVGKLIFVSMCTVVDLAQSSKNIIFQLSKSIQIQRLPSRIRYSSSRLWKAVITQPTSMYIYSTFNLSKEDEV